MSANAGIPASLPLLIISVTLASLTFFLFAKVALLNRPFSPGPIFFSSLSALWQTEHCSNTSLPFSALPAFWANTREPVRISPKQAAAIKLFFIEIRIGYSLQFRHMALQPGDAAPDIR